MKVKKLFGRLALILAAAFLLSSLASCITITLPARTEAPELTEAPTDAPTAAPTEEPVSDYEKLSRIADGKSVSLGRILPSGDTGEDGDLFLQDFTSHLYRKVDGKWTKVFTFKDSGLHMVTFTLGGETTARVVKDGELIGADAVPEPSGKEFSGWYDGAYHGKWDMSKPVTTDDVRLAGFWLDSMDKTSPLLTYRDVFRAQYKSDGTNAMLVIFVSMTDGHIIDRGEFENMFSGDYPQDECFNSIASYFKYASYGRVDFDFAFRYYDTGLTCKEAYDKVHREYNDFLIDIFDEIRNGEPDLMRRMDKDGDGMVDSVAFICGEDTSKTVGDGENYYLYGGAMGTEQRTPDKNVPQIRSFIKMGYESISSPPVPGFPQNGIRVLIHETSHIFGVDDYYDFHPYGEDDSLLSTLGCFDMQDSEVGDWNPFSRFACGWTEPYVITDDIDSITLRIGCSANCSDAVLIPTSKGWNGTPFDEYILIDVLAPFGANGFDWEFISDPRSVIAGDMCEYGGVRVYHVDERLVEARYDRSINARVFRHVNTYDEILAVMRSDDFGPECELWAANPCSNGWDPYIETDSRFWHAIEIVPRDGSSKYRISTPTYYSIFTFFSYSDLFGEGDVFSMETCFDSFADAPCMNNGGTFDYEVRVDHYDMELGEAIITITRIAR